MRVILAKTKSDNDLVECLGQCLDLANLHSMDVLLNIGNEDPPDPDNFTVCLWPGMTRQEAFNSCVAMVRMRMSLLINVEGLSAALTRKGR